MPNAGRRAAMYWLLESRISPRRISVPMETISAFVTPLRPPRLADGLRIGAAAGVYKVAERPRSTCSVPERPARRRGAEDDTRRVADPAVHNPRSHSENTA